MFNSDFYPTPENVIEKMLLGVDVFEKIILEPSAGKGDIVDFLNNHGAKEVIFCEIEPKLADITSKKARFICDDFLKLQSSDISHVDFIIMNPPFTADEKHILHAFSIAPAGCKIISLANSQTVKNPYTEVRKQLKTLIETYGSSETLGPVFVGSERTTGVSIDLIKLQIPGGDYSQEFAGFFMDEEEEEQGNGIISYNAIRDLVNRYKQSIIVFDQQLTFAQQMNDLTKGFFSVKMGMTITNEQKPIERLTFKKEMQKSGWNFVFEKMNMKKYATKGLKEDINKFVEQQHEIPFTMSNIYRMIETIIGTTSDRMNRAAVEVFDKVTQHYHENRHGVEGWKTNSHYLLNKRFIFPNIVKQKSFGVGMETTRHQSGYGSNNYELLEDLVKVLAFMNGQNYDEMISFDDYFRYPYRLKNASGKYIFDPYYDFPVLIGFSKLEEAERAQEKYIGSVIEEIRPEWGKWNDWGYFRFRAYKKGTCHLEFKSDEVWGRFNQKIAEIKGFPLYEKAWTKPEKSKGDQAKKKPHQAKKTVDTSGQKNSSSGHEKTANDFKILGTFQIKST